MKFPAYCDMARYQSLKYFYTIFEKAGSDPQKIVRHHLRTHPLTREMAESGDVANDKRGPVIDMGPLAAPVGLGRL